MMKKRCCVALLLSPLVLDVANAADEGYRHVTGAQISALTQEQVASIKDADLAKLPANLVANLVNPMRIEREPRCTGAVKVRVWAPNHARQASRLTDYQISQLRAEKFNELRAYDYENIAPETLRNLDVSFIHPHELAGLFNPRLVPETEVETYAFTVSEQPSLLSNRQIKGLTPQQLAELRYDDLHNLPDACIQELSVEQINALSPRSISYLINPARFVAEPAPNRNVDAEPQPPLLSRDQFNNLRPEQLRHLTSDVYDILPFNYLAVLDRAKKAEIYPDCLSPEKLSRLPDDELRQFSDIQLRRLKLSQIRQLNPNQVQLFRLAQLPARGENYANNIRDIPPVKFRALNNDALNRLLFG